MPRAREGLAAVAAGSGSAIVESSEPSACELNCSATSYIPAGSVLFSVLLRAEKTLNIIGPPGIMKVSTHTALMPHDLPFTLTGQPLLGTPGTRSFSIKANRYSPCLSIIYGLSVRPNGDWPNLRHGDGFQWRKNCQSTNLPAKPAFGAPEQNPDGRSRPV